MIIDSHAHIFPHHGGASGYKDVPTHLKAQQATMANYFGRMLTNTLDPQYIPGPDEKVDFRVGRYGRYYWNKNGKEIWLQRFPPNMVEAEWTAEQMVAYMDFAGVDTAILQSGYMEVNYCREFFYEGMKKFPGRLIGSVSTEYSLKQSQKERDAELDKIRREVGRGMRAVFQGYLREEPCDDPAFEPYLKTIIELGVPHFFWTGFQPKKDYLDFLARIEKVMKKFPELKVIIGHLGGNIRPPGDPNFTDTPSELRPLMKMPNFYFEVGYVLAYENWAHWKENYEYPYPLHTKLIKRVYDEIGADRLLWASDMPFLYRTCTYLQCLDMVRLHFPFLNEEEKKKVLGENAKKLFGI
ncbi:MAG TPA: amidohydrolase family protein [Thermodesulfobacteriota bacterium]|nr:amidohydrolase family protein [Thermodesulfobacteriota bacterium]